MASDIIIKIRLDGLAGVDDGLKKTQSKFKKFGDKTAAAVTKATQALALPVAAAGAGILKASGDFELAMNQVSAVSGATQEQFAKLRDQAKELGATTQFSASEAAQGMSFLAKAGFDANEVLGAMPKTLELAASAQMDLATTADIVSNVLSGYGLEVKELARVNDVMVKAFISSNTDLQQLGEAMKFAGPVASAMGQDFEEVVAALGKMGDAGIQASMAGTSLRGALTRLANPAKSAADILDGLGVTVTDSAGNMRPLLDILEELQRAGLTSAQAMEIFGQRAGPAMLALMQSGIGGVREFAAELKDSAGTSARIAAVQMEGFNGALKELKSAMEGLAIAIGDSGLLDFMTHAAKGASMLVRGLAALPPGFEGVIQAAKNAADFLEWMARQFLPDWLVDAGKIFRQFHAVVFKFLVKELKVVVDNVGKLVSKVTGFFKNMEDEVTGNSYVPDMVKAIGFWFDKLDENMVKPTMRATDNVQDDFLSMYRDIDRESDGFVRRQNNSWSGLFRSVVGQAGEFTGVLSTIFDSVLGSIGGSGGGGNFTLGGGGIGGGIGGGGSLIQLGGGGFSGLVNNLTGQGGLNIGGFNIPTAGGGSFGDTLSGLGLSGVGSLLQEFQTKAAVGVGNMLLKFGASTDFASNIVQGISELGFANMAAGFAGGQLANLLGIGGDGLASSALSSIGGIVGGLTPLGPLGSAIGSFLGSAIGGLFGGPTPHLGGSASIKVPTGQTFPKGSEPQHAVALVQEMAKQFRDITAALGGTVQPSVTIEVEDLINAQQEFGTTRFAVSSGFIQLPRTSNGFGVPMQIRGNDPTDVFKQTLFHLMKFDPAMSGEDPGARALINSSNATNLDGLLNELSAAGYEQGGDAVFTRPSLLLVGEHNRPERVNISPLSGAKGGGNGTQIYFQAPVILDDISMSSFIRQIEKALSTKTSRF